MKRFLVWTAAMLLILSNSVAVFGQVETPEITEAEVVNMPRIDAEVDLGTAEKQVQLRSEFQQIENAYKNVVKYYNKDLPDETALAIARLVLIHSDNFKLDPRLVMAVITVESRFRPTAVSPKGAMGLGQLMPGTAAHLGVSNAFDMQQNIYGTARYLRTQYDRWAVKGDVLDRMLASYNAGPEAVARHNGVPPYRETRNYVQKVKRLFRFFVYGY